MSHRKLPPNEEVVRLVVQDGRTLQSIADEYGASRQAVSNCLRGAGHGAPNAIQPYKDWIPWRVRVIHNNDKIVRRLRRYARMQMGEHFRPGEEANLRKWVERMRDLGVVVDYHPDTGFVYVPRRSDEPRDQIIRRPGGIPD
jgi:hypothetical protein